MKYLVILPGFDPTSIPSTPTNAELLQMVQEAQSADDVGFLILSDTAPNVTQYPILGRFRWAKTSSGTPIGEFYYHDGSSWVIEKPAAGTVTADALVNGSITLDKLSPDGDPYQIIRINAAATGFEFVDLIDAIANGSLSLSKLANASGQSHFLMSSPSNQWTDTSAQLAAQAFFSYSTGVTSVQNQADKLLFRRVSDDLVCNITVVKFLSTAVDALTAYTITSAADYVPVWDDADALLKKVPLASLLPTTGVVAATYAYPASISVNARGQITAITGGTQGQRTSTAFETADRTLPTVAGSAGQLQVAHGLGGIPRFWGMQLVCVALDGVFSPGEVLDYRDVLFDVDANDVNFNYLILPSGTNLTLIAPNNPTTCYVISKTTGARQSFTPSKWIGHLWASL